MEAAGSEPGVPSTLPAPKPLPPNAGGRKGLFVQTLAFFPQKTPHISLSCPKGLLHPARTEDSPRRTPQVPPATNPRHTAPLPQRAPSPICIPCPPPTFFSLYFLNNPRGAASYGRGSEHHELPRTGLGARAGDSTRRGGGGELGSDTGVPPPWEKCPLVMGGGTQQNPHQTCPFVPLHLRVPPYPTPPHRSV